MAKIELNVEFSTLKAQEQVKQLFQDAAEENIANLKTESNKIQEIATNIFQRITTKILAKVAVVISLLEGIQPITDLLKLIAFSLFYTIGKFIQTIIDVSFPAINDKLQEITGNADVDIDVSNEETKETTFHFVDDEEIEAEVKEIEAKTEETNTIIENLIDFSKAVLDDVFTQLQNVDVSFKLTLPKFTDILDGLRSIRNATSDMISALIGHLKTLFAPFINNVSDWISSLAEKGKEIAEDITEKVKETIAPKQTEKTTTPVKKSSSSRSSSSRSSSKKSSSSSSSKKETPVKKAVNTVKKTVSNVVKKVSSNPVVKKVVDTTKKAVDTTKKVVQNVVKKVVDTTKKVVNTVKKTVSNVVNKAKNIFRGLFGDVIIRQDGSYSVPNEYEVKTAIGINRHRRVMNYYGVASPELYDYVKRELGGVGLSTISKL